MPKEKNRDDEDYLELLENLDACGDMPPGRGDNIELDDDDERVLREIYSDHQDG